MPTTTGPAALPFPGPTDPPNVPGDIGLLAQATANLLHKAFPCTDGTKPTGLAVGDRGFLIDNATTGNIERWTGTTWAVIGGGGGGGGGFAAVEGQWTPSSAQSIPNADTVIAFGTQEINPNTLITRSTSGSGHKFALNEAGAFGIYVTCRFASGLAGRRFIEIRNGAQTARYASEGFTVDDGDTATVNLGIVRRFSAGAEVCVIATQTGQANLSLQHEGASIVPGFVRINIIKVAG